MRARRLPTSSSAVGAWGWASPGEHPAGNHGWRGARHEVMCEDGVPGQCSDSLHKQQQQQQQQPT
eukprot:15446628-Alexandrium_andersonii.AAC.1